jgi:hypothetical protein
MGASVSVTLCLGAATAAAAPTWGMFSVPAPVPSGVFSGGVRALVVEMTWARAEPTDNRFDASYFQSVRNRVAAYRAAGYKVVLNMGMHHAPPWLLAKPNARFVNQDGVRYTASDEPNLIFATTLRPYAQDYVNRVMKELGTNWYAVRVGGGHWGELTYPQLFDTRSNTNDPCPERPDGKLCNYYWAFDGAAKASNPVPTWKPGKPSPNGEAGRFINWYINSLTKYQNWQIGSLRTAGYTGSAAVLYPSWGVRSGQLAGAVSRNLDGSTSVEVNGELQRGFDHQRHIAAVTDSRAVVWGTWADKDGTLDWLASLARAHSPQLAVMGENAGPGTTARVDTAMREAQANNLTALFWVRYGEAHTSFLTKLP